MTEGWTNQHQLVLVDVSPFRLHLFTVKRKPFSHFCLGQSWKLALCPSDQSASFGVRDTKVEAIYDPIVLKKFGEKKRPTFGPKNSYSIN